MKKIPNLDFLISILVIFMCIFFIRNSFRDEGVANEAILSSRGQVAISHLNFEDKENKLSQRRIVVFSTSWCGQCRGLIRHLKKAGLSFMELDIESNSDAARTYSEIMGRVSGPVPVTVVGDRVFIGAHANSIIQYALGGKS